jgi:aspartate kinase
MVELNLDTLSMEQALGEVLEKINAGEGADYAASRGEYLNAKLVAQYLGWTFIDAADVIELHADGTIAPKTWFNLQKALKPEGHYVLPGFYGMGEEQKVKTFSRGGSDISGAILARAVQAELYENWTDVAGCFNADPRYVKGAAPILKMTYREVRELSAIGASVFHEEAIAPVREAEIPINIRNTNDPAAPGTLITASRSMDGKPLVGVSAIGNYSRIIVSKLMLFKKPGTRHALLTMMHIYGIRPTLSLFGIDSIVWYFDSAMASDSVLDSLCARIKEEFQLDDASFERGFAIVGIVGQGIMTLPHIVDKASTALVQAGIPLKFVNYGASSLTMLLGVAEEDRKKAVQALFDEVFA